MLTRGTSRRDVLRTAAAGTTAIALGGIGARAVEDSKLIMAQSNGRRAAGAPDITKIAFDLEYDANKIFDFVQKEVTYDPYSGVLRGALGTLWGKAGNSADQTLLLQALLNESQITSRLVVGSLENDPATKLLASTNLTLDAWKKMFLAAVGDDSLGESDTDIIGTPEPGAVDQLTQLAQDNHQELHDTVLNQVKSQSKMISDALASAKVQLTAIPLALPRREVTRHAWLQIANGTEWLDLDPSIPDAEFGKAYASNPVQIDAFDPDEFHQVKFRALGDVVRSGSVTQEEWLSTSANSADLVGQPINFFHVKPGSLGAAIDQSLGGTDQYEAFLQIGTASTEGKAFIFTGQGGVIGALGGNGSNEGEPVAEWVEITITSPDADAIVETRAVFDRIGDEARAAGNVDSVAANLKPIETFSFAEKSIGPYYLPLVGVMNFAVVSAAVPAVFFKQDWSVHDTAGDLSFQNHGFHFVRDSLSIGIADQTALRFFRNRPCVTGMNISIIETDDKQLASTVAFDLIQATSAPIALAGATTATVNPGIVEGALNQACERAIFEIGARVTDTLKGEYISVGRIFETAQSDGTPLLTLAPDGEIPDQTKAVLSASAQRKISDWQKLGYVIVVPSKPVSAGKQALTGFWAIDPKTGRTIDRLENGTGSELPEDATLLDIAVHVIHEAYVLSTCIIGVCLAVAAVIAMGLWGVSDGKVAAAVGGAVHGGSFCLAAAL